MKENRDTHREYPPYPIAGVGVVVRRGNSVLLVKRGHSPSKGVWTVPGGVIELGEGGMEAAAREVEEECGIKVRIDDLIDVYDYLEKDEAGKIRYHYVILDYLGTYLSGNVTTGGDAVDAAWFKYYELFRYDVPTATQTLIQKAFQLC